ncbi:hypothetical protein C5167_046857 [Papaver somniferum]|uniref:Uncharacterized protein n=1 Tax=Papaver somniferum TaxID=3469 RepID=A0A4Y7LH82_PAPSO|nr:uncharacterized protein At2g27730, mitochondrial-like [Papaver somniferum]RZC84072.1 hypothetical protein C5167_046857 [Papaver somniferum]
MAMRMLGRSVSRRFSTGGGKILSEEEKAAENIYIKKIEKEKLEKLAHKGSKPEEQLASTTGIEAAESASDAKLSVGSTSSTTSGVYRNYAIYAAVGTSCAALGWYLNGSA